MEAVLPQGNFHRNSRSHESLDKTKIAFDPVPNITYDEDDKLRNIEVEVAFPEEKQKMHRGSSYKNVKLTTLPPNRVPLSFEFKLARSKPCAQPVPKQVAKPVAPEKQSTKCNEEDRTFLTSLGLLKERDEDVIENLVQLHQETTVGST